MSASIKIFKEDLKNYPELSPKLSLLCVKVTEEFDSCVYTPEPGLLMTFLKLLGEQKINYELVYGYDSGITYPNSTEA